jgi:hypothetical protein
MLTADSSLRATFKLSLFFLFMGYAYPDDSGATALTVRFYDGFQYFVTLLAGFVPFSSNLLKNRQVFLFPLKHPDRQVMGIYF